MQLNYTKKIQNEQNSFLDSLFIKAKNQNPHLAVFQNGIYHKQFNLCRVCKGFGKVLWSSGDGIYEKLEPRDCPLCINKGYIEKSPEIIEQKAISFPDNANYLKRA